MLNHGDPELDKTGGKQGHSGAWIGILSAGLVIALAGDAYLLNRSGQLRDELAQTRDNTQAQLTKLSDATTSLLEQRLEAINAELKSANESADSALKRARIEALRQGKQLAQRLDDQQKEVSGELSQLKDATTSKFAEVSTDVNGVKSDVSGVKTDVSGVKEKVASTDAELEKTGSDLKRVMGDMGVMSGLIATNAKDLNALRELGDRNYTEFDLTKRDASKKLGDIVLTLKKADPKRNRYTVDVLADDKRLEKRDRTINEPVQLYVSGNRQPYEIVINEVRKDEVIGYLAHAKGEDGSPVIPIRSGRGERARAIR